MIFTITTYLKYTVLLNELLCKLQANPTIPSTKTSNGGGGELSVKYAVKNFTRCWNGSNTHVKQTLNFLNILWNRQVLFTFVKHLKRNILVCSKLY